MKTSFSALTGKSWGPEASNSAENERKIQENAFKTSEILSYKFYKIFVLIASITLNGMN